MSSGSTVQGYGDDSHVDTHADARDGSNDSSDSNDSRSLVPVDKSDARTHAGVAVFSNAQLVAAIADFQSGYSDVVLSFYRAHASALSAQLVLRDSKLLGDGVLPHMAVAAGDTQLLQLLHRLALRSRVGVFARVAYCAVLFRRADVLACVAELKARDAGWEWEPGLMRLALRRPQDVDVRVLEWLGAHLPAEQRVLQPSDVSLYARSGDLAVVRWLIESGGCEVPRAAVDAAVHGRRLHMLEYLYAHSAQRCSRTVVDDAARNGYTDIVRLVVSNRRSFDEEAEDDSCRSALSGAARNGHLDIVKLLVESDIAVHDAPRVMDHAAENGHLDVVEYLHLHYRPASASSSSANSSSSASSIADDAVCTTAAMDGAARNGHFEMVKFLHAHREEGCTTAAMDGAAENGHLAVVTFLHEYRNEGCSSWAIEPAINNRHWDVVVFLCKHRLECHVESALEVAVSSSSLDAVKLIHRHMRPELSSYRALKAAVRTYKRKVIEFLCTSQAREPTRFLTLAIEDAAPWVAQVLPPFSTLEELAEAKALALETNQPRIVKILERSIRTYGWTAR